MSRRQPGRQFFRKSGFIFSELHFLHTIQNVYACRQTVPINVELHALHVERAPARLRNIGRNVMDAVGIRPDDKFFNRLAFKHQCPHSGVKRRALWSTDVATFKHESSYLTHRNTFYVCLHVSIAHGNHLTTFVCDTHYAIVALGIYAAVIYRHRRPLQMYAVLHVRLEIEFSATAYSCSLFRPDTSKSNAYAIFTNHINFQIIAICQPQSHRQ